MGTLIDAANLASGPEFQKRVASSLVHTAINIVSEVLDDVQTLTITGSPTAGTFTLTGSPLAAAVTINWNDGPGQVQSKIQADANVGQGGVVCTGTALPAGSVTIEWAGKFGSSAQSLLTVGTNSLTGGSTPTPHTAHTTVGVAVVAHAARAAFAAKVLNNPSGFASLMALGVADSDTVKNDWNLTTLQPTATEATVTTDINNQVSAIWNAYI